MGTPLVCLRFSRLYLKDENSLPGEIPLMGIPDFRFKRELSQGKSHIRTIAKPLLGAVIEAYYDWAALSMYRKD